MRRPGVVRLMELFLLTQRNFNRRDGLLSMIPRIHQTCSKYSPNNTRFQCTQWRPARVKWVDATTPTAKHKRIHSTFNFACVIDGEVEQWYCIARQQRYGYYRQP